MPVDPCDIANTLGGCNIDDIKDLTGVLAEYNESGDDVEVVFPLGLEAYNAQPKFAREQSGEIFPDFFEADCEECINGNASASSKGAKGPK